MWFGHNIEKKHPAHIMSTQEETRKYCFFWRKVSPFSQWHPSVYQLNGVTYSCAEQGMMHGKALVCGDKATAQLILDAKKPREMRALGRQVRGFTPANWEKHRERVVFANNMAKFTQNPGLRDELLGTGDIMMVEAAHDDLTWGIGLSEQDARRTPKERWPGLNLLGKTLMRVREQIRLDLESGKIDVSSQEEQGYNNSNVSLSHAIVEARVAKNMTQKALAAAIHEKPQVMEE